jgi:hypothetical protein
MMSGFLHHRREHEVQRNNGVRCVRRFRSPNDHYGQVFEQRTGPTLLESSLLITKRDSILPLYLAQQAAVGNSFEDAFAVFVAGAV